MKLFVKHILKVILGLILCAYALDFMYSQVYLNSKFRNKIQLALQDAPEEYDLIFLGSSRANNHFVTALFEKKGLKAFNFGMSGASLEESALLLELLITKQSHLKNVVLEVDLNLRSEFFSNGTRALFMPYLKNNLVISDYYKHTMVHYNRYLYIPFYRYITYETKIGFREMIFSLFHKKSKLFDNKGYEPLFGSQKGMAYDLRGVKPSRNKNFEKIRSICKAKRINLIVVTTPICENTSNKDYFKEVKKLYPEVHNFENVITGDKYFSSCGHLNDAGAIMFTNILINKLAL